MARSPRAGVSKTTGQGVSRRAYQTAYSLGQHGTGGSKFTTAVPTQDKGRDYGKSRSGVDRVPPINVSYGDTIEPSDLADINNTYPKRK